MTVEFGTSNKGKPTVIFSKFRIRQRARQSLRNRTTSWRCQKFQSMLAWSPWSPARCRVRRHSSQHQQRRGVAPRAAVTVPVLPSNRVEFHDWDSVGHSAPESTISAGYDWSNASVSKKISFTERSCCATSRSLWSCWCTCLSSCDCVFVALIDTWDCNWHVRILVFH